MSRIGPLNRKSRFELCHSDVVEIPLRCLYVFTKGSHTHTLNDLVICFSYGQVSII